MAKKRYTKDELIGELLEHNKEVAKSMANITNALQDINDSNRLHSGAINKNTEAIQKMVNVNSSFMKFMRWVIIALIVALIVLAGAEKALKFIPAGV